MLAKKANVISYVTVCKSDRQQSILEKFRLLVAQQYKPRRSSKLQVASDM